MISKDFSSIGNIAADITGGVLRFHNSGVEAPKANKFNMAATDIIAGNTTLDLYSEGTGIVGAGTGATHLTLKIKVNGTMLTIPVGTTT